MADDVHDSIGQQADLLDEWVEVRRQINALEARAAELLGDRLELMDADVAASPASSRRVIERSMIAEYSAASRVSKGSIEYSIGEARMLADLPSIMASFQAGLISLQHVRNILRAAGTVQSGVNDGTVEPSVLGLFEQAALEYAENESAARTDAHVKELAAALVPASVVEQNRRGEKERKTWIRTFEDGMSLIQMLLPTVKAEAIMDRASALVKEALAASDTFNPDFRLPIDWDAEFAEWQAYEQNREFEEKAQRTGYLDRVWIRGDETNICGDAGDVADAGHWMEILVSEYDEFHISDEACAAREAAELAALEAGPEAMRVIIDADDRTMDQARTDVMCDLLLGASPSQVIGSGLSNVKAQVQVTINATTLAGLDDNPAQLDGVGPISPDAVRELAAENKGWTRLFLNADGMVTRTDTYTPTAGMQKFLRARDQHCRFPGCRQPVHRTQIDHTFEHSCGGPTDINNLAHLCVTHHSLKHPDVDEKYRWHAVQHPDWTITWTSPLGHTYTDKPPKRVMFVPSGPPPGSETSGSQSGSKRPPRPPIPDPADIPGPAETAAYWARNDAAAAAPWEH